MNKRVDELRVGELIYKKEPSPIFSMLGLLWHKKRWHHRMMIFEREKDRIIKEHAGKITNVLNSLNEPRIALKDLKNLSPDL